jgi:hypothetical protein
MRLDADEIIVEFGQNWRLNFALSAAALGAENPLWNFRCAMMPRGNI